MPGPPEDVPRWETQPAPADDLPRWEPPPAAETESAPRWPAGAQVPRWEPEAASGRWGRRLAPGAVLDAVEPRRAPLPRASLLARPFVWWSAHPWAVIWACVLLAPVGVLLLRVVDEAGVPALVVPLAWMFLGLFGLVLLRGILLSARRSLTRPGLGLVAVLVAAVGLLWPVTRVTLGRVACPPRAGSNLGVQTAALALQAWRRGEPGETSWRNADPTADWRAKSRALTLVNYQLVDSGCFERVAPIDASRTWHDFRVTVREGERTPLSKVVIVHTAAEGSGWKITAIEGPLP